MGMTSKEGDMTIGHEDTGYPLVSVVITTFKRDSSLLQEALESVLAQTYPSIEVIVVNDNGNDSAYTNAARSLCGRYKEILYHENPTNKGVQYSRNIGILMAKGQYIAFLDDDDIWSSRKIEVQMKLFEDFQVGMVYCDGYSFIDDDRASLGVFREASLYEVPISQELELFNDYIGSTSQAIVRRECFANVGLFDTDMPARQDYEMWLRISGGGYKIVGSTEKLLYYRKHSGERISTDSEKSLESYRLILKKYAREFRKQPYAKAKLILRLFAAAKASGHLMAAAGYFVYALVTSPLCVLDVVVRNVRNIPFSEYYDRAKLARIIKAVQ